MTRRKNDPRSRVTTFSKNTKSNSYTLVDRNKRKNRVLRIEKEVRYFRNTVNLIIPKSPFIRIVKEILDDYMSDVGINRIQALALEALQEAMEAYIVQYFEDCMLLVYHAKRVTLMLNDMILMRRLRGRDDIINK